MKSLPDQSIIKSPGLIMSRKLMHPDADSDFSFIGHTIRVSHCKHFWNFTVKDCKNATVKVNKKVH